MNEDDPSSNTDYEPDPVMQQKLEEVAAAREGVLSQLGDLDADVYAPLMNPTFMGGPQWPSLRQAWRVVRRKNSTIIVSDGLSDPFEEEKIPLGFKVEVCAEASELFDEVHHSWLFSLVYQVSQLVAHHGNVYGLLENYKSLSTVVHVEGIPEQFESDDGRVGVILGFPAPDLPYEFKLNDGNVRLLVIKLLWPSELKFIEGASDLEAGRNDLIKLLQATPEAHISSLNRKAVV